MWRFLGVALVLCAGCAQEGCDFLIKDSFVGDLGYGLFGWIKPPKRPAPVSGTEISPATLPGASTSEPSHAKDGPDLPPPNGKKDTDKKLADPGKS